MKITKADEERLRTVLFYLNGANAQFAEFQAHVGSVLMGCHVHYEKIGTYLNEWRVLLNLASRALEECDEEHLADWADNLKVPDEGGFDISCGPEEWRQALTILRKRRPAPEDAT